MVDMAKKAAQPATEGKPKRERNAVYLDLDEPTLARVDAFIAAQRVKPTRPAVLLAALLEFLDNVDKTAGKK